MQTQIARFLEANSSWFLLFIFFVRKKEDFFNKSAKHTHFGINEESQCS